MYRPPLRLSVGQRVTVGQQDTRWPAFVFVTAEAGQTGCHRATSISIRNRALRR
jgi:hypothetical protein